MSAIRTAVISAAVSFAAVSAASAMTVADLGPARVGPAAQTDFAFGDVVGFGRPASAEVARATQDYFDYDTLITLGALALAGGGLAALGAGATRQKPVEAVEPAWRESVMRAVQAELAQFTTTFRRAA
jgi:hypothetical protein